MSEEINVSEEFEGKMQEALSATYALRYSGECEDDDEYLRGYGKALEHIMDMLGIEHEQWNPMACIGHRAEWRRDDGYSGCKTERFGHIAAVICPPEGPRDLWGYQLFNEADASAMMYGEIFDEGYSFASERDVMRYLEERLG